MSLVTPTPVSGFQIGTYAEVRDHEAAEEKPVSTVAVWTPPPQPGTWQRVSWSLFGRPEPGVDGRFDHVVVDASLITVPRDPGLARVVLALGRSGELSVKRLYDALASDREASLAKPKALAALRKELRIAAEKLDARSPGAKVVDDARNRLQLLRRELDVLDVVRAQPDLLATRLDGGAPALLAAFDGHHAEVTSLLAGASAAVGVDHDALEIVRAGAAALCERRNAMHTSLGMQIMDLRSAKVERDAAAASLAAAERVAAHDAAIAERARVDAITGLSGAERALLVTRIQRFENLGGRFFGQTSGHVRSNDVLAHLALGGIEYAIGQRPTLRFTFAETFGAEKWTGGDRTVVRDLAGLEDVLKRAGA